MRRFFAFTPALALLVTLCGAAQGQDLPTTHDHGITIGPDELTAAIQETQDFWGPVRTYLLSPDCPVANADERAKATAYLKEIHDGLHVRLFEMTEADAMDLIAYLAQRLRMFEVYRKLRTTIGDDSLTAGLIQAWEFEFRNIHKLAAAERGPRIAALLTRVEQDLKAGGVTGSKLTDSVVWWKAQADVVEKMAATGAGKMMIDFEIRGEKELDVAVGQLLLDISGAADWVLITRAPKTEIGRDHFVKAYGELQELRSKYATAAKEVTNR